ncbi:MAG TPA: hypothetical protein VKR52_05120 [Terracidiphilus sp.]|nr:hypothetical protein [Terracidiphilus sp.]
MLQRDRDIVFSTQALRAIAVMFVVLNLGVGHPESVSPVTAALYDE